MEHADVDDFECGDMMEAMIHNTSLLTLDLRDNLIGDKEQLNVVMPELLTGGEAVAEMMYLASERSEHLQGQPHGIFENARFAIGSRRVAKQRNICVEVSAYSFSFVNLTLSSSIIGWSTRRSRAWIYPGIVFGGTALWSWPLTWRRTTASGNW